MSADSASLTPALFSEAKDLVQVSSRDCMPLEHYTGTQSVASKFFEVHRSQPSSSGSLAAIHNSFDLFFGILPVFGHEQRQKYGDRAACGVVGLRPL